MKKTNLIKEDLQSSSSWGNYKNTSINYNGRVSKAYTDPNWELPVFSSVVNGQTNTDNVYGDMLSTGASDVTEKYHIYDISGNLWEWTEEMSTCSTSGQYYFRRGGSCANPGTDYSASYRYGDINTDTTFFNTGFRVVLYIK